MRDDNFDRELNAALAKYAAVEPRHGLEERVLTNLCAQREREVAPNWGPWLLAVVGGTVVVLATIVFWRGSRTTGVTRSSAVATQQQAAPAPVAASLSMPGESNFKSQMPEFKERQRARSYASADNVRVSDAPKLEQFPAPEPLSEQERLLMQYVADDPGGARLVAEIIVLAEQQELSGEPNRPETWTNSKAN